ncbi:hypothetical protein T439DRAFT_329072 [Meredithblackwellia eburnea MCA 4105]
MFGLIHQFRQPLLPDTTAEELRSIKPSKAQDLIPEILTQILFLAHNPEHPSTTINASHVCRAWREPAQRILFHHVFFHSANSAKKWKKSAGKQRYPGIVSAGLRLDPKSLSDVVPILEGITSLHIAASPSGRDTYPISLLLHESLSSLSVLKIDSASSFSGPLRAQLPLFRLSSFSLNGFDPTRALGARSASTSQGIADDLLSPVLASSQGTLTRLTILNENSATVQEGNWMTMLLALGVDPFAGAIASHLRDPSSLGSSLRHIHLDLNLDLNTTLCRSHESSAIGGSEIGFIPGVHFLGYLTQLESLSIGKLFETRGQVLVDLGNSLSTSATSTLQVLTLVDPLPAASTSVEVQFENLNQFLMQPCCNALKLMRLQRMRFANLGLDRGFEVLNLRLTCYKKNVWMEDMENVFAKSI